MSALEVDYEEAALRDVFSLVFGDPAEFVFRAPRITDREFGGFVIVSDDETYMTSLAISLEFRGFFQKFRELLSIS